MAAGGSKQASVERKQGSLHGKVRDKAQKWREMRNARLSLLWYSVAHCRQQAKSHRQVLYAVRNWETDFLQQIHIRQARNWMLAIGLAIKNIEEEEEEEMLFIGIQMEDQV